MKVSGIPLTEHELELLKAYFVNQGLRLDNDFDIAIAELLAARPSERSVRASALSVCALRKQIFDKIAHDVFALLNI